jgi:hypothetical protein
LSDRPTYETKSDRNNEQRVVEHICARWDCAYVKMPKRYELDYALHRQNEVIAFVEVKCRNYTLEDIGQMGGYMLSLAKWNAAQALTGFTGRPFYLAVQTLCGGWVARFRDFESTDIRIGGRTDRKDWQDTEPVVMIPTRRFQNFRENFHQIKP